MVLPLGWEKVAGDVAEIEQSLQEHETTTSVTVSDDIERLHLMKGMMSAMQTINDQKKRMKILLSVLKPEQVEEYHNLCLEQGISP